MLELNLLYFNHANVCPTIFKLSALKTFKEFLNEVWLVYITIFLATILHARCALNKSFMLVA